MGCVDNPIGHNVAITGSLHFLNLNGRQPPDKRGDQQIGDSINLVSTLETQSYIVLICQLIKPREEPVEKVHNGHRGDLLGHGREA